MADLEGGAPGEISICAAHNFIENFITEKDLDISVSAGEWDGVVGVWLWSQRTHAVMIILLLYQNNEAFVASCIR